MSGFGRAPWADFSTSCRPKSWACASSSTMQLGFSPSRLLALLLTGLAWPSPETMALASASRPCCRSHTLRRTIFCMMPNTMRACCPVVAPHTTLAPGSPSRSRWYRARAAARVDLAALRATSR